MSKIGNEFVLYDNDATIKTSSTLSKQCLLQYKL